MSRKIFRVLLTEGWTANLGRTLHRETDYWYPESIRGRPADTGCHSQARQMQRHVSPLKVEEPCIFQLDDVAKR